MPSVYLSDADIEAIRACAAQLSGMIPLIEDLVLRQDTEQQIQRMQLIEKRVRQAKSSRQLRGVLKKRYSQ